MVGRLKFCEPLNRNGEPWIVAKGRRECHSVTGHISNRHCQVPVAPVGTSEPLMVGAAVRVR
jgi:hypothetical protein